MDQNVIDTRLTGQIDAKDQEITDLSNFVCHIILLIFINYIVINICFTTIKQISLRSLKED